MRYGASFQRETKMLLANPVAPDVSTAEKRPSTEQVRRRNMRKASHALPYCIFVVHRGLSSRKWRLNSFPFSLRRALFYLSLLGHDPSKQVTDNYKIYSLSKYSLSSPRGNRLHRKVQVVLTKKLTNKRTVHNITLDLNTTCQIQISLWIQCKSTAKTNRKCSKGYSFMKSIHVIWEKGFNYR